MSLNEGVKYRKESKLASLNLVSTDILLQIRPNAITKSGPITNCILSSSLDR